MGISLKNSSIDINVMIVIDTDYVKRYYSNPSQDLNNPTAIDHNSQFMICGSSHGIISGQGTADLNFKANVGDHVVFRSTSIYGNSDDAIIVYGIKSWGGNVFNNFVTDEVTITNAVSPNPDSRSNNGLPVKTGVGNFVSYKTNVRCSGIEHFWVDFALYTLENDGNTQKLKGYYQWDPTITVK